MHTPARKAIGAFSTPSSALVLHGTVTGIQTPGTLSRSSNSKVYSNGRMAISKM